MTTFGDKREGDPLNIEIERQTQVFVDTLREAIDERLGPLVSELQRLGPFVSELQRLGPLMPALQQLLAQRGMALEDLSRPPADPLV